MDYDKVDYAARHLDTVNRLRKQEQDIADKKSVIEKRKYELDAKKAQMELDRGVAKRREAMAERAREGMGQIGVNPNLAEMISTGIQLGDASAATAAKSLFDKHKEAQEKQLQSIQKAAALSAISPSLAGIAQKMGPGALSALSPGTVTNVIDKEQGALALARKHEHWAKANEPVVQEFMRIANEGVSSGKYDKNTASAAFSYLKSAYQAGPDPAGNVRFESRLKEAYEMLEGGDLVPRGRGGFGGKGGRADGWVMSNLFGHKVTPKEFNAWMQGFLQQNPEGASAFRHRYGQLLDRANLSMAMTGKLSPSVWKQASELRKLATDNGAPYLGVAGGPLAPEAVEGVDFSGGKLFTHGAAGRLITKIANVAGVVLPQQQDARGKEYGPSAFADIGEQIVHVDQVLGWEPGVPASRAIEQASQELGLPATDESVQERARELIGEGAARSIWGETWDTMKTAGYSGLTTALGTAVMYADVGEVLLTQGTKLLDVRNIGTPQYTQNAIDLGKMALRLTLYERLLGDPFEVIRMAGSAIGSAVGALESGSAAGTLGEKAGEHAGGQYDIAGTMANVIQGMMLELAEGARTGDKTALKHYNDLKSELDEVQRKTLAGEEITMDGWGDGRLAQTWKMLGVGILESLDAAHEATGGIVGDKAQVIAGRMSLPSVVANLKRGAGTYNALRKPTTPFARQGAVPSAVRAAQSALIPDWGPLARGVGKGALRAGIGAGKGVVGAGKVLAGAGGLAVAPVLWPFSAAARGAARGAEQAMDAAGFGFRKRGPTETPVAARLREYEEGSAAGAADIDFAPERARAGALRDKLKRNELDRQENIRQAEDSLDWGDEAPSRDADPAYRTRAKLRRKMYKWRERADDAKVRELRKERHARKEALIREIEGLLRKEGQKQRKHRHELGDIEAERIYLQQDPKKHDGDGLLRVRDRKRVDKAAELKAAGEAWGGPELPPSMVMRFLGVDPDTRGYKAALKKLKSLIRVVYGERGIAPSERDEAFKGLFTRAGHAADLLEASLISTAGMDPKVLATTIKNLESIRKLAREGATEQAAARGEDLDLPGQAAMVRGEGDYPDVRRGDAALMAAALAATMDPSLRGPPARPAQQPTAPVYGPQPRAARPYGRALDASSGGEVYSPHPEQGPIQPHGFSSAPEQRGQPAHIQEGSPYAARARTREVASRPGHPGFKGNREQYLRAHANRYERDILAHFPEDVVDALDIIEDRLVSEGKLQRHRSVDASAWMKEQGKKRGDIRKRAKKLGNEDLAGPSAVYQMGLQSVQAVQGKLASFGDQLSIIERSLKTEEGRSLFADTLEGIGWVRSEGSWAWPKQAWYLDHTTAKAALQENATPKGKQLAAMGTRAELAMRREAETYEDPSALTRDADTVKSLWSNLIDASMTTGSSRSRLWADMSGSVAGKDLRLWAQNSEQVSVRRRRKKAYVEATTQIADDFARVIWGATSGDSRAYAHLRKSEPDVYPAPQYYIRAPEELIGSIRERARATLEEAGAPKSVVDRFDRAILDNLSSSIGLRSGTKADIGTGTYKRKGDALYYTRPTGFQAEARRAATRRAASLGRRPPAGSRKKPDVVLGVGARNRGEKGLGRRTGVNQEGTVSGDHLRSVGAGGVRDTLGTPTSSRRPLNPEYSVAPKPKAAIHPDRSAPQDTSNPFRDVNGKPYRSSGENWGSLSPYYMEGVDPVTGAPVPYSIKLDLSEVDTVLVSGLPERPARSIQADPEAAPQPRRGGTPGKPRPEGGRQPSLVDQMLGGLEDF